MLSFFPIPYLDELLYSVLCRYHLRSGNRSFRQTKLDLFKTAGNKQYYLGLPNNLATLVHQLPFGSNLTLNQLLQEHTLFPYYRTFLTNREVKRLRKKMERSSFKGLKGLRDEYKQGLMKLGLWEEERLAEAILKRYREGVLKVIHPEMMENLGEYVSGCLLGCDLLQEVDRVVHWLVEGIKYQGDFSLPYPPCLKHECKSLLF